MRLKSTACTCERQTHASLGQSLLLATSEQIQRKLANNKSLARRLAADASRAWVVPRVGGHAQVLVSAMRPTLLGTVRDRLAGGTRAPRALLESLGGVPGAVEIVPEDELRAVEPALGSFFDLDTPGDLEELRRIEAARGET